jgi:RNA polymerase sigma-70 factor (ECF subfamily)
MMTQTAALDTAFEAQRGTLFGLAYRMLGSAAEAEDIVQDTYVRLQSASDEPRDLRAYVVTIATRLCLDQLKSARAKRESYVGPWLPEPIRTSEEMFRATPEGAVSAEESISLAFLVLLESLGPVERAVFLLRDVFDYEYSEIAAMVGRSETNCRQVLRRARQAVDERRPRFVPTREQQRAMTLRFIAAATEGDMSPLLEMLTEDVTVWSDGGGKVPAATRPVRGRDHVLRLFGGFGRKEPVGGIEAAEINGQPGVIFRSPGGRVSNVLQFDLQDGLIGTIYIIRNPDKLIRVASAV